MVVVSGGGWGVGDIAGAVREFTQVPEVSSIVCLAGRNEQLAEKLRARLRRGAARARVRLHRPHARAAGGRRRARALDRRRHLPGGDGGGHAGRLLRAARRPRAPEHARDGRARPAAAGQRHRRAARARAGELRVGRRAQRRRRERGARRRRSRRRSRSCCRRPGACARSRAGGCALVGARDPARAAARGGLVDDVHRRGDRRRGQGPATCTDSRTSRPTQPDVGADRARPRAQDIAAVAARARPRAASTSRSPTTRASRRATRIATLRALGDELLPEVPASAPLRWLRTRGTLRSQARALGLCTTASTTCSPRGGLSVGQLVLARTAGRDAGQGRAAPERDRRRCLSARCARATCVVVELDGSAASLPGLERIVSRLASEGLRAEPLGSLTRSPSISASSSGERASIAAPPTQQRQRQRQRDAAERRVAEALAEQQRREHHRHEV